MKKLLSMLSDWVEKGYVDGDVWKDLSEFVRPETIASALNKSDSSVSISNSDVSASRANQMDRILSHVSQYVYPSELKEFAVKRLGLRETKYEMIKEDHIYAKRRNFEVNLETNQNIREVRITLVAQSQSHIYYVFASCVPEISKILRKN